MKATRKKLSCRFSPQSMKPSPRRMTPSAGFLPRNSLYFTITRRKLFCRHACVWNRKALFSVFSLRQENKRHSVKRQECRFPECPTPRSQNCGVTHATNHCSFRDWEFGRFGERPPLSPKLRDSPWRKQFPHGRSGRRGRRPSHLGAIPPTHGYGGRASEALPFLATRMLPLPFSQREKY